MRQLFASSKLLLLDMASTFLFLAVFLLTKSIALSVALGMALSLDPLPRNLSLGRSFGLAIVIGFGYWLSLGITSSLGRSGLLPGMIAAWMPNFMFSMIALSIFLFGEER